MAEKVIIGKNCLAKVVYDNVPQTYRIEGFNENDEAELRMRDFLGQDAPETDYIEKGYTGDFVVLDSGPRLDRIVEDMKTRRRANLPALDFQLTLTRVFRDGATTPTTVTFRDVVMTVGTQVGGRTDDVKRPVKYAASNREFTE